MTFTSHAPLDLNMIDPDPFGSDQDIGDFLDLIDAEMAAKGVFEQ